MLGLESVAAQALEQWFGHRGIILDYEYSHTRIVARPEAGRRSLPAPSPFSPRSLPSLYLALERTWPAAA